MSLQGPTTTHPTPQAHKRTTQRHREPSRTLRPNMAQSSGSQTVKVTILSRCVALSCKLPAHLLFIAPGACWPAEQDALSVVVRRAAFDYAPPRLHGHLLVSWRALTLKSFNISHTARRAQVFHGVPFAAPPEGDLRWSPPRAPDKWILPRPAILTRPVCEWRQPSDQPTPCLSCASHTLWQQIFEQLASRTHACRAHHTPCSCSAGLSSATWSRP